MENNAWRFHYEMLIGFARALPDCVPFAGIARHAAALCAEVFVLLGV